MSYAAEMKELADRERAELRRFVRAETRPLAVTVTIQCHKCAADCVVSPDDAAWSKANRNWWKCRTCL